MDNLIPHLSENNMAKEMFCALVSLFHNKNMNRNMVLRNKLRSIHMSTSGNVTSYLMRITQVCDQLAAMGEKKEDVEIVNVALNGLTKFSEPFVKGIFTRENIPYWQRVLDDCIQEDSWEDSKRNKK